jgi:tyrosinase
VRHEVRDLKNNFPDQWNLYLLGLGSLQWVPQSDPLSYYGLASGGYYYRWQITNANVENPGIHGRPFQTWGDVPGLEHKLGTSGYCPHSNTLFLGWHRPYLALFEVGRRNHVAMEC